eukprot:2932516-Alexandrium_andersonii.AAC.1
MTMTGEGACNMRDHCKRASSRLDSVTRCPAELAAPSLAAFWPSPGPAATWSRRACLTGVSSPSTSQQRPCFEPAAPSASPLQLPCSALPPSARP